MIQYLVLVHECVEAGIWPYYIRTYMSNNLPEKDCDRLQFEREGDRYPDLEVEVSSRQLLFFFASNYLIEILELSY